ncbi:MAG: response regulator, partial [Pseudomonadota bacterium]
EAVRNDGRAADALPSFAGKRVLAADDSAVNREVVAAALARFEIAPVIVEDGRAAVEAVKREQFDLVLMDCSMPGMDGFEATRAIRAFEKDQGRPHTPVIALTAHVAGSEDAWRAAGMDDYVTKPFTIGSLAKAICARLEPTGVVKPRRLPDAAATPAKTSATSATKRPIFDEGVLGKLDQLGDGVADRTLSLFEKHSKEAALGVADAVKSGVSGDVKRAAHALKSMSLNVGANRLAAICDAIESEESEFSAHLPTLREEFLRTHKALPAIRKQYEKSAA